MHNVDPKKVLDILFSGERPNIGPDRLELIIFDIIGKKFYNHPSRLQL